MLLDLLRALLAALLVGVGPGWFWSRVLYPGADAAGKICLSVALSFALVPAVALIPVRFLGIGVTLAVAVLSALAVFVSGLAAYLAAGPAKPAKEPLAPAPEFVPATGALAAFIAAFGLMLASYAGAPALWTLPPLGLLLLAAVIDYYREPRSRETAARAGGSEPGWAVRARRVSLAAIAGLVLFRGYSGPVIHDWPFIRGVDQYSHAVMAQRMMTVGEISPYLIYPPGFHTITAAISRLSGLRPLEIFPVLAPALLLLPVLALYALARRLWGPWCGVAAALLGGLVFTGSYHYFSDAMYPNMVAGQFLLVLAVAALFEVYARPSARSGALFAALGGSVALFHQVASLYLALLLALVSVSLLPALLRRERRRGLALLASLAGVGVLAALYAWETYDFGRVLAGGAEESEPGGTLEAIRMAIGSQMPFVPRDLIGIILTQPLAWLGLFGAFLLALRLAPAFRTSVLREGEDPTPGLVNATLLLWLGVMVAGASTSYSGFPQRFARDLGVPLSLLGALAAVAVVAALARRGPAAPLLLSLAVPLMATAVGLAVWVNLNEATAESTELTFTNGPTATTGISAAGDWLRAHNEGGNIMVSPQANQVPSRMMLAMGGYSAMQSYTETNIQFNRDLPPAGADAMRDVLRVMRHPEGPLTRGYLAEYDIRYLVLFKDLPDRRVVPYWTLFDDPGPPYATVFENPDVLIVEPRFSDEAPAAN